MNDHVTPEERALIDAAIAEGRVQKIPAGQRAAALAPAMLYDQKARSIVLQDKQEANQRLRYCSVFKPKRKK